MARLPNTRRPGSPARAAAPPSAWAEALANRWPVPIPARCERLPPKERPAMLARPTRVPPICGEPAKRLPRTEISRNMRATDARPANIRRTEGSAAEPAKPAAMPASASEGPPATAAPDRAGPASTATMPAASAAAGVCLECEKRYDEDQYRGHASASRQHKPHGAAGLDAPRRRSRLGLGIPPRTKSF